MMEVRVGVVGVGHRARTFLPALAKMEDVKLLALADLDALRLQTAANEYRVDHTFALLSEMLDAVRLDAVVILTPDPSHHPQTIAALDWGVHVLVEKPPAYTVEEMQQMAEASDKAGKHLMVAWNRTFGLLRVKELFAHQPPKVVMADYVRPDPTFLVIIRTHMVDPLYFLCGEPAQVVAKGEMFDEHKEGHVVASIRFQNGSLGQLTGSFGAGGNSERFTAYGDGYTVFVESTSRGQGRIMRGSREVESFGPVDTVQLQIRHFIDCVREDKEPLNSGHDAVRIVRFMWDIMDAAGIGIPPTPDDDRGWLLWCACGERVIPRLDRCPNCGQEWAGWSLPRDQVRRV